MRISNDVLNVLSAAETDGNVLKLTGQLDRALYTKTNKVLEAAGGKWNRKLSGHVFESDASSRVEDMILTGEVEVPKDEFNYFPTPKKIVARLMELAEIKAGMRVLEPSAGQGAIAKEMAAAGAEVMMFELMQDNYAKLVDLNLPLASVLKDDFLMVAPIQVYDRVVMNPPFLKQSDIKHVLHALKFLKEDGLLIAVMSSSVTFRDNKLTTDFRKLVEDRGGEIESCPDGSFKESGTMVNTVIVTIPA